MTAMRHRDDLARIGLDEDLGLFAGHVVNLSSPVTFYGRSIDELQREFATSLEVYREVCRERGVEPEKPYSGRFNLRLPPDLHRGLARAAARSGKSLNAWAVAALRRAAEDEDAA